MKTLLTILSVTLVSSLLLGSSVMALTEKNDMMFKGYTKTEHKLAFPEGHPATNTLNKCIWDEESALYFCQYDLIKTR